MWIRVIVVSEMNCCLKSGIHEHSPNSLIRIQIFDRNARLSSMDSFVFPCQMKNWLRVQGVAFKLCYFWQQILLCSTRSQAKDCLSLLNLLLLDATGLPAAFASTRQGMHPSVSLEKSTLRRMSLVQHSSCFTEDLGISGLLDAIGLDAVVELVAIKEDLFLTAGRDLDTTLSSFWSWLLFANVEQLIMLKFLVQQVELKWLILNKWRRLFHSSRVKFPLVNMSASWSLESM